MDFARDAPNAIPGEEKSLTIRFLLRTRCAMGQSANHRETRTNKRPNPNDLFCAKCGHKGSDKRHEYHHHMGYGTEHVYDVVVLCSSCHSKERYDE